MIFSDGKFRVTICHGLHRPITSVVSKKSVREGDPDGNIIWALGGGPMQD